MIIGLTIYLILNLTPDVCHDDLETPMRYAHIVTLFIALLLTAMSIIYLVTRIRRRDYAGINLALAILIGNLYSITIWFYYLNDWAGYTEFYLRC